MASGHQAQLPNQQFFWWGGRQAKASISLLFKVSLKKEARGAGCEMHLRNAHRSIRNEVYFALHCAPHPNIVPSHQACPRRRERGEGDGQDIPVGAFLKADWRSRPQSISAW